MPLGQFGNYGLNGLGGVLGPNGVITLTNGDGTGLVVGSICYVSGNDAISKAFDNGTLAQASAFYISLDVVASGGTGRFVSSGLISGLTGGTFNTMGYLGVTAGAIAAVPDLTVGRYNVLLGLWLSATEFQFRPEFPILN